MRKLLPFILALAVSVGAVSSSFAQVGGLSFPGPGGGHSAGGGGGGSLTWATAASNTDISGHLPPIPYATAALGIGTASSDRIVVVAIAVNGATSGASSDISAVTGNSGAITFAKATFR